MTVSALTWKALRPLNDGWPVFASVQPSTFAPTAEGNFITAIEQLLAPGRPYLDGTSRVPGQGLAWTTTRLSDNSLTLSPVSNPNKIPQIVHLTGLYTGGGTYGLPNLVYSFGETNISSRGKVVSTLVLNPGSFAGNTINPFGTSANGSQVRCMGYFVASPCESGTQSASGLVDYTNRNLQFRAWESQDAILIHIFCPQTSRGSFLLYGGWMAPDPTVALDADAEADGIIYGVATSGNMTTSPYSSLQNFYNGNSFFSHLQAAPTGTYLPFSLPHTAIFSPGTSTILAVNRLGTYPVAVPALNTISNKLVKMPNYFSSANNFIGRAREMWVFRETINGLVLRSGGSGGTDKGWIASGHNTVAWDSLLLGI